MRLEINVNEQCEVVLSDYGAEVFIAYYRDLNHRVQARAGDRKRMPLWECMQIFGKVMFNGNPKVPFIGNTIEVVSRDV